MTATHAAQSELHWREPILRHFSADIAKACRATVVADPDGLLQDDLIATRLRGFGFDVVRFDDPVKFRFVYETQHRRHWDAGESTSIVVSIPGGRSDLNRIPHDVLWNAQCAERVLSVSLAEIFEGMAATVLAELDVADLDLLWQVRPPLRGEAFGPNQTRDFVLRAVFKLSPEIITRPDEIIAHLARLHHAGRVVPDGFARRFAEVATQSGRFADWPLVQLVAFADTFFTFVQERWRAYLAGKLPEAVDAPGPFSVPGPADLPFDSPEVRSILDNLFFEGRLKPIPVRNPAALGQRWESIGVEGISKVGSPDSVRQLIHQLSGELPEPSVPPTVWTAFAFKWAELARQMDSLNPSEHGPIESEYRALQASADSRLQQWLGERYAALANRSYLPNPMMVHQIPHFMAHRRSSNDRVALVIVDGMSLSQWFTVRDAPGADWRRDMRVEEFAVFAWIPTITSISRQAIFAGQAPLFFESTILSTHAEEKHWKAFWEERGRRRESTAVVKHGMEEPEASLIDRTRAVIDDQRVTVIGIVVNSIDRLVHGVGSGSVLQASVSQWARDGHLVSLLYLLIQRGFEVFVGSDHGNVTAHGTGRLDVGSIPDERGHRAMLFPDANTRDAALAQCRSALPWSSAGLPPSAFVALATDRSAFVNAGAVVRTHGGASIDELLVPFVRIVRA
ncbi:MAG: BREX-3 system phosphatase PglZ [Planctomycetes bacterium]|nr:BREX-3 system phosphatase PglZ [Planctomycetota bacterium]